jgi:hypothetical protein
MHAFLLRCKATIFHENCDPLGTRVAFCDNMQDRKCSDGGSMHITIEQARAVETVSPGAWTIQETEGGWTVGREQATLITTNGRKIRVFRSVDGAINELKRDVGAKEFKVVAAVATA